MDRSSDHQSNTVAKQILRYMLVASVIPSTDALSPSPITSETETNNFSFSDYVNFNGPLFGHMDAGDVCVDAVFLLGMITLLYGIFRFTRFAFATMCNFLKWYFATREKKREKFAVTKFGRCFHKLDCKHVQKKSNLENSFENDLIKRGFIPCLDCMPENRHSSIRKKHSAKQRTGQTQKLSWIENQANSRRGD